MDLAGVRMPNRTSDALKLPPISQPQGTSAASVPGGDVEELTPTQIVVVGADDSNQAPVESPTDLLHSRSCSPSCSPGGSPHHSHAAHRAADGLAARADVPTPLGSLYEDEDSDNSGYEDEFGSDVSDEDVNDGDMHVDHQLEVSSVTAEIDKFVVRNREQDSMMDDGVSLITVPYGDHEQQGLGQAGDLQLESESDVDPGVAVGPPKLGQSREEKSEDVRTHRCARVDAGGGSTGEAHAAE